MQKHEEPPACQASTTAMVRKEYSATRVLHQVLEQETAFVNLPRSTLGCRRARLNPSFTCGLRSDREAYPRWSEAV